jgi:hypothetical protein
MSRRSVTLLLNPELLDYTDRVPTPPGIEITHAMHLSGSPEQFMFFSFDEPPASRSTVIDGARFDITLLAIGEDQAHGQPFPN